MYSLFVASPLITLLSEDELPRTVCGVLGLLAQVIMVCALFLYIPTERGTFIDAEAASTPAWWTGWIAMQVFLAGNVYVLQQLQQRHSPGGFTHIVLAVMSAWVLGVAVTLTHSFGGRWLHRDRWRSFNPLGGGVGHVVLQMLGWCCVGFAMLKIGLCGLSLGCEWGRLEGMGASVEFLTSGSIAGLLGELLLAASLLLYQPSSLQVSTKGLSAAASGEQTSSWAAKAAQLLSGTAGGSGFAMPVALAAFAWAVAQLWPLLADAVTQLFEMATASPLGTAVASVLALSGLTLLNLVLGEEGPETYAYPGRRRAHLDFLRAQSKQFPPPFPNAWYCAAQSEEVAHGAVQAVLICGVRIELTRTEDGKVAALLFEIDSEAEPGRALHVYERVGLVLVWIDPDGNSPMFEPTMLDELEDRSKFRHIANDEWRDFMMHVMEPSQNSADWYHFQTVHAYLGQGAKSSLPKAIKVDHQITVQYGNAAENKGVTQEEYAKLAAHELLIHEYVKGLRILGVFPLPRFFCKLASTRVFMQGPTVIQFMVDNWLLGQFRAVFTLTPVGPFKQRARLNAFASPRWPWVIARLLQKFIIATVDQDRQVWEHKLAVAPRNLVRGDGPFLPYGKWMDQFYGPSSVGWDRMIQSRML